jgi:hypothetical protein
MALPTHFGRRTVIKLGVGSLLLGFGWPADAEATTSEFVALWRALAGGPAPEAERAVDLERLFRTCHPTELDALLARWANRPKDEVALEAWIRSQVWSDRALRATCKDLVLTVWFGVPFRDGNPAPFAGLPDEESTRARLWAKGRFWDVIEAHAPGEAVVPYGDWSKSPRGR